MASRRAVSACGMSPPCERHGCFVSRSHEFADLPTDAQQTWLNRIREHLTVNLTIGEEDLGGAPVLSRAGGCAPANEAFEGDLATLARSLNEAVAA